MLMASLAGSEAYQIERSLRFNSADTAYLNRTPSSAGNRKTWTWAGWVKRGKLSVANLHLFDTAGSPEYTGAYFTGNDRIEFRGYTSGFNWVLTTTPVFRDPSSWYHIVFVFDSTNGTSSDRLRLYVNGERITTFSSTAYPSLNYDSNYNNSVAHNIGTFLGASGAFDGYLADIYSIDGQALDPTSFGEFDNNNVWQPKEYSGTYGTNGFHLDFSDYSSNAALGTDSSGNSNNWTVNNIAAPGSGIVYSSNLTTNTVITTGSLDSPFDGNISTDVYGNHPGAGYFLFSGVSIPYTTSLEVYYPSGRPSATVALNGSNVNVNTPGAWNTIATGSGTLTSLKVSRGGDSWFFSAIRVDGTILVSYNPIEWDSLADTPTDNYAVMNSLNTVGPVLVEQGALYVGNYYGAAATIGMPTGKFYWEVTLDQTTDEHTYVGIDRIDARFNYDTNKVYLKSDGNVIVSGVSQTTGSSIGKGDVVGCAFNADTRLMSWYINGSFYYSVTAPSVDGVYAPWVGFGATSVGVYLNAGQRPFIYSPPSGYDKMVRSNDLPDPTIADGSTAMDVVTYTGNGSTQTISGLNFSPDLVWTKSRSNGYNHNIQDIVRGFTTGKKLGTNLQQEEGNSTELADSNGYISSQTSDGYVISISSGGSGLNMNATNLSYVAWTWDAGSSTVTNTNGSITSSVRANPSAGFSIVSYTGNLQSNTTVGHGLNAEPYFIIVKERNSSNQNWNCYHKTLGNTKAVYLNLTNSSTTTSAWSNTTPTSSVFTVGAQNGSNGSGKNIIAYCFAPVDGYSSFGSYIGNSSADGPFVYTGFRPRWVLFKLSSSGGDWRLMDTERDPYNPADSQLYPNNNDFERSGTAHEVDYLSNGFKVVTSHPAMNDSGQTYIYAAFAEHPLKTARAR